MIPIEAFDTLRFLQEYGVEYRTEGRDVAEGWVGIKCPFCLSPDPEYHMGINVSNPDYPRNIISCFRCGKKGNVITLVKKLVTASGKASKSWRHSNAYQSSYFSEKCLKSTLHELTGRYQIADYSQFLNVERKTTLSAAKCPLPEGTTKDFYREHIAFLEQRRFCPDIVIPKYDLYTNSSKLLIPIYQYGRMVSYVTRDTKKRQYRDCPKEQSLIFPKHTLYELDRARDKNVIVVEGVFDAWRIGSGSVATLGTEWSMEQAGLLVKFFSRVFVLFDSELEAQERAEKLVWVLASLGTNAIRLEIPEFEDPDKMSDSDVRYLRVEVFGHE